MLFYFAKTLKLVFPVSGQDVERGTFSQRHHVLHHQNIDMSTYNPLANLYSNQVPFRLQPWGRFDQSPFRPYSQQLRPKFYFIILDKIFLHLITEKLFYLNHTKKFKKLVVIVQNDPWCHVYIQGIFSKQPKHPDLKSF
jgi:hypothetical protein